MVSIPHYYLKAVSSGKSLKWGRQTKHTLQGHEGNGSLPIAQVQLTGQLAVLSMTFTNFYKDKLNCDHLQTCFIIIREKI